MERITVAVVIGNPERTTIRVILSGAKDLARSASGESADAGRKSARRDSSLQQLSLRMTPEERHNEKNLRAKGRPRHFAISYHWVQGSPLPREA
jgi:hypothetical protein